jgi:Required for nuclear transport of RNA pol II C-terminus 1/Required for nuclear transport of RNA pol II C-terminus 2
MAFSLEDPDCDLESISKVRGQSVVDRLFQSFSGKADVTHPRIVVLRKALDLLLATHRSLVLEQNSLPRDKAVQTPQILYEPKARRTIYGLFDLISLEGIYPSLSPGVGVPLERRVKSVLPAGVIAKQAPLSGREDRDLGLLQEIVDRLLGVYPNARTGISPICRERVLVDLIAACGELAFGPDAKEEHIKARYTDLFKNLVDEYVSHSFFHGCVISSTKATGKEYEYCVDRTNAERFATASTPAPDLLPILTSLLLPTTPAWLRPHLLAPLSLVPLRPGGVRHTIEFIASACPLPPETQNRGGADVAPVPGTSRGPPLPLEALAHASRLLSSIPSHLSPQEYYSQLAPQLFDLLDGGAGPEIATAAAFTIASVLGRKAHGAPGEAGWNAFAEPLFARIDPSITNTSALNSTQGGCFSLVLVPESELELAVTRLVALTTSHPNPGLTKRLLGRVFLPLWGLLCFAKKTNKTTWYDRAVTLTQLYLKLSASEKEVIKLAEEILFDGRIAGRGGWVYGLGSEGGVELRRRPEKDNQITDMIEKVDEIDARVREFVFLLSSGVVDDRSISEVFLNISRRLLQQSHSPDNSSQRLAIPGRSGSRDPLQTLVSAKIVQRLLEMSREKLTEKPTEMFELIQQILVEFVERFKTQMRQREELRAPSLAGLGNIVQLPTSANGANTEATAGDESIDIVSTGLSLLTAILTSFDSDISERDENTLTSIQNSLKFLSSSSNAGVPITLSKTAANLLSLLSVHSSLLPPTSLVSSNLSDPLIEDKKTYALALSYLGETLVPVRVQGLHLLEALIQSRSALLDIEATVTLLLSLLQDEDEFIYLNVIKTLTTLADRHGNAVTKTLVERYVDRGEDLRLDQRLRLGEALLRIIQRTGAALVEETARVLGEGMMEVAGRRGQRLKEMEEKQRLIEKREARNREAKEAWGGEVPQIGEDDERHEDKGAEILAKIVEGWESKSGEDTRVRTSALSIYGAAIETNAAGLGSQLISTAIDLAISILTIEKQEERAILRRAAAMLILSVLKAIDEAEEGGRNLGFGFAGENLAEVITVLSYAQTTDNDGLVREYAETIVKELEMWRVKSLVRASSSSVNIPSSLANLEGGGLAGLPRGNLGDAQPYIEEIE